MKKLSTIICLFMLSVNAFSQWHWQNPLPQGNMLNSISFVDSNTGYAAGDAGTVVKTTDGGLTWVLLPPTPLMDLFLIFFTDSGTGYALGGIQPGLSKTIIKTVDGGMTWSVIMNQDNIYFTTMYFIDANT